MEVRRQTVHAGVKWFVFFHLVAVVLWSLPRPPDKAQPAAQVLKRATDLRDRTLGWYMLPTGFWQSWDMFAPNPADTDVWMDAVVRFTDGSESVFSYPRIKELPLWQKYHKERYRKFAENATLDVNSYMWPAIARKVVRETRSRTPVQVVLRRHLLKITPPGGVQDQAYRTEEFFTYIVRKEDL